MIVLITGATSGFGMSCAELFSKKGYKTILIGRRKERLTKLSKKLGLKKNLAIQLDVRDKEEVFNTINNLPRNFKDISVLINNAGTNIPQHFTKVKRETMEYLVKINTVALKGVNDNEILNLVNWCGQNKFSLTFI